MVLDVSRDKVKGHFVEFRIDEREKGEGLREKWSGRRRRDSERVGAAGRAGRGLRRRVKKGWSKGVVRDRREGWAVGRRWFKDVKTFDVAQLVRFSIKSDFRRVPYVFISRNLQRYREQSASGIQFKRRAVDDLASLVARENFIQPLSPPPPTPLHIYVCISTSAASRQKDDSPWKNK